MADIRAQDETALASVKAIYDAANQANSLLDQMEQYAEDAGTSLTGIYADAESAKTSAESATQSADIAFKQLSIVENVVGVLDLISKHGDYQVTTDTEVIPDKWYFTRSGTAPNYVYAIVPSPAGDPSAEGWYELTGIDQAIQNYVSSQLVVDTDGLWLKTAGMQTKVLLSSTDGVVLYGTGGEIVGRYGATAQIGDAGGFHIDMGVWYKLTEDDSIVPNKDYYTRSGIEPNYTYTKVDNPVLADIGTYYDQMPAELGFYEKSKKVAYINNDQLYITKTVVLQQMQLGTPVAQGGADALGQWSWKVHPNKQTPRRNNLNLKWNG